MKIRSKSKTALVVCLLFLFTFLVGHQPLLAWFGAGQTPGFPATSDGLHGEMELASYKFAPDYYRVGDVVTFSIKVMNPTTHSITFTPEMVITEVTHSPASYDISDGTPSTPGVNENDLYDNFRSGDEIETPVNTTSLSTVTINAGANTMVQSTYTTTKVGYFHFTLRETDGCNDERDEICNRDIAMGFIRVQKSLNSPTPTPTPTPTPKPGRKLGLTNSGPGCNNPRFDAIAMVTENGLPAINTEVRFEYNGQKGTVRTDSHGRAQYGFSYAGPQTVSVSADGVATVTMNLQPATCTDEEKNRTTNVVSAGTTTTPPTLAPTGVADQMASLSLIGMLTSAGVWFVRRRS
jgi:hypothetical protein